MAVTAMVGGTDNNQFKSAAEDMIVEGSKAVGAVMATATMAVAAIGR